MPIGDALSTAGAMMIIWLSNFKYQLEGGDNIGRGGCRRITSNARYGDERRSLDPYVQGMKR